MWGHTFISVSGYLSYARRTAEMCSDHRPDVITRIIFTLLTLVPRGDLCVIMIDFIICWGTACLNTSRALPAPSITSLWHLPWQTLESPDSFGLNDCWWHNTSKVVLRCSICRLTSADEFLCVRWSHCNTRNRICELPLDALPLNIVWWLQ